MAVLEVRNVKKVFGDNVILRGIDLDVQKGDVIVILGPSGSGKTTFLRCLNLLEKPDEGSMVLNGREYNLKNVKNKEKLEIRRNTSFVFHNHTVCHKNNLTCHFSCKLHLMCYHNHCDSLFCELFHDI